MGIGMRLYLAHDSDLRAFTGAPRTLQMWLRYPHSLPETSLKDSWQDLDSILLNESFADSRSLLRPQGADWTYPFVADRGAHAISATSTVQLLSAIDAVDRARVEAYVRRRAAAQTKDNGPPAPALTPEELSRATDDLLHYLSRLRESCALAVSKGYGVLMALWDEL